MSFKTNIYKLDQVIPLRGTNYFDFVFSELSNAKIRVWVSMFIVNPAPKWDDHEIIRRLIKELDDARHRFVDVRFLIGFSDSKGIYIANEVAFNYMRSLGIPVRTFIGKYRKSLHSKYILIDNDQVIVGSHNWTPGASQRMNEDSIAIYSRDTNLKLKDEFSTLWERAKDQE